MCTALSSWAGWIPGKGPASSSVPCPAGKEGALCSPLTGMGTDTVQRTGLQGTDSRHQLQRVMVLLGTKYRPMLKTHQLPQLRHQQLFSLGRKRGTSAVCVNQLRAIWDHVGTQATRSRKDTLKACLAWVHGLWTVSRNTKNCPSQPLLASDSCCGKQQPSTATVLEGMSELS